MNVWATSFSAAFFLCFACLISFWLGPTLHFTLAGMAIGGAWLARFDGDPMGKLSEGFFYTPSRWLALLIMLAIAARLVYGWWHAVHHGAPDKSTLVFVGVRDPTFCRSCCGLIGYDLVYAIGYVFQSPRAMRNGAITKHRPPASIATLLSRR